MMLNKKTLILHVERSFRLKLWVRKSKISNYNAYQT